ncbi:MAG: MaoC/PaaZ C-terminal domain-containing protein [Anaerolineae bacterium]
MKRPTLPRRIPRAPEVGETAVFTRTLTDGDVSLFIGATWDVNPFHTDDNFVKETRFGRRIVPGLLTASLLTHLGGLWNFLGTKMTFEFLGPVYVGDTVTAVAEVGEVHENGRVRLLCRVTNTDGVEVLKADILGFPGTFEE